MKKFISVIMCVVMLVSVFTISAFAKEEKLSYLVLGDSIAYASGVKNAQAACYGKIVADTNEYKYLNYAVPGHTTTNLINRLSDETVLEAVKDARAQGDLSENFEYYAAKREKNRNEGRIRYLERMIKTAEIIDDSSKDDEVGMNNSVEVLIEEDQLVEIYRLVTTVRGNSLEGLISNESPLGKALLGRKVGDRVYVEVNPDYGYYVKVLNIDKTNDDSKDKLRSF